MEAAGLASSIISILDLTAKVISRSYQYISKTQNAPEYLRAIGVHLPLLARALEIVKRQALSKRIAPDVSTELVSIVKNASEELKKLNHYVAILTTDNQSSKLTKINRAVKSVLRYDTKIEETLDKLKGYTDTLNFFQTSVATGKTDDILGYLRLIRDGQIDLQLQYERDNIKKWLAGKPRSGYIDACITRKAPGTCDWIFSIPAYSAWLSSASNITDPNILWIHGPPGVGKTFISAAIFARIEANEAAAAVFWTSEGAFANASLIDIPRSWIAQLLTKNLATCECVQRVWSNSKSDIASPAEVWSALKNVVSSFGVTTLIIDGLDEYQQQQARRNDQALSSTQLSLQHMSIKDFLATLKRILRGIPCRILCVSQPDAEIKSELEAAKVIPDGFPHCYVHAITKSDSQKDLDAFAKYVIDSKLPKKSEQFRTDLSSMVASKAEGQMLWIALQDREAHYLRPSFSEQKLRQVIESAPRGLDQLYEMNLNRINQLGPDDKKRARRILNWILYGLRPFTVHEIVEAILIEDNDDFDEFPDDELPEDPDELDVYGELRTLCGNFIAFDMNGKDSQPRYWQVRLAHSSVRAFLSQRLERENQGSRAGGSTHNALLARLCVRYLIYDNVWPENTANTPQQLITETHPFLTYATTYFTVHVNSDNSHSQDIEALLHTFLISNYNNYSQWQKIALDVKDPGSVGLATKKESWQWSNRLTLAAYLGLPSVVKTICDADDVQNTQLNMSDSVALQAASWSGSLSTVQVLLDEGFQLNRPSEDGTMPLHIAAAKGHTDIAELLLRNGAELNAISTFGTPIHRAAWYGREGTIELFLLHNANLLLVDYDGCLPLHNATKKGYRSITRALLRSEPVVTSTINVKNDDGWSPLLLAVDLGDGDLVKILLQAGGNPTQLGYDGKTPLLLAAEKGKEDVFNLIFDACGDISNIVNTFSDRNGESLLHLAVHGRNLDIVKKLVQKGADDTKLDNLYRTPLDRAISWGYVDVVEYLFARRTDHDSGLRSARPIHHACQQGDKDLVAMLIREGADLKVRTKDGWTPLTFAVQEGQLDVVQLILGNEDGRTTVNSQTEDGFTPLQRACFGQSSKMIELLLENGADILTQSVPGYGPMCSAASSGKIQAVQTLFDKCGFNFPELLVLHAAAESGSQDVFDLLKNHYPINSATFPNGSTLLHCAAAGGNVEIINHILSIGDANQMLRATTKYNHTVLSWATGAGNIEAAKLFLRRCAQISPPAPFDDFALYTAIEHDNLEVVQLFYEADPVNFVKGRAAIIGDHSRPPLLQACYNGRAEIMQFLIEKGFNILDCDDRNRSCLHEFAATGHEDVARFFRGIDWRTGLAVFDTFGNTPLIEAARCGQTRVFRRFVRQGASMMDRCTIDVIATRGGAGNTLLHAAAVCGDSGITEIIIEAYGQECLEWRNLAGESPAHIAAIDSRHSFLEYIFGQGARMDALSLTEETPLFLAVVAGSEIASAFLLSKGLASFEKRLGSPIVAYAALLDYPYILNGLLDHGFELSSGRSDGVSLLHLAAGFHSRETVTFLLSKGLDWNARDDHGWTARDCLETSRSDDSSDFGLELSVEPRSWLQCSAWAFRDSESSWFVRDKTDFVAKVRESNRILNPSAPPQRWTMTADHYLLPTPTGSYFEVTFIECPTTSAVAIALAVLTGEQNRDDCYSALYCGDSGWARALRVGDVFEYAYPYGQGDTIGCGIDYKAGNLFFTKNGKCLGCAFDKCYERYTPAVYSLETMLTFEGNFGQKPFLFDIAKHGWDNEEKCKRCYEKGELRVRSGDTPTFTEGEEEWAELQNREASRSSEKWLEKEEKSAG